MSKAEQKTNNVSSEQGKELLNFWDTSLFYDDGSIPKDNQKSKCNKYLRKKLRKYKKRKNGEEDPEVLEVTLTLNSSLRFPVPDYHNNNNEIDVNSPEQPPNYLMKMVRKKSSNKNIKTVIEGKHCRKPQEQEQNETILDTSQQTEQKNAFQLMMQSRNKSIGSNSPGKEMEDENCEFEVILQKKARKAQRSLLLQKMAEAKGALKNKQSEEVQEMIIKQKMKNRAERLKVLLSKGSRKKKPNKNDKKETKSKAIEPKETEVDTSRTISQTMLVIPVSPIISPKVSTISREDEEFLNKLSPSIKKKENMMCYFKKINKESETSPDALENQQDDSSNIIKVKLASRNKKSLKKRKLSLKNPLAERANENPKDCNENNCKNTNSVTEVVPKVNDDEITSIETGCRKRKRKAKLDENSLSEVTPQVAQVEVVVGEGRPRRNVKKPIKYSEETNLSSSDDEIKIFTPKKKKHIIEKTISLDICKKTAEKTSVASNKCYKNKESSKKSTKSEPKSKIAPIFMPKPQIDPAVLEAKQKFLQSGVPLQLKKISAQQTALINNALSFNTVVHVQQEIKQPKPNLKLDFYKLVDVGEPEIDFSVWDGDYSYKKFLSIVKSSPEAIKALKTSQDTKDSLQKIKESYPEFPVYRTYRTLINKSKGDHADINFVEFDNSKEALDVTVENKNDDPKSLCWVDKYKANSTKQIIGNFDSIKELRKWLVSWIESQCAKGSQSQGYNSDSSDFCMSDADSRDNAAMTNNLLIVSGPTGSGKTSSVHAVAAELAIKVIEVNVGSRRTGKILLQDLQEATRSHKVNRLKGSSAENSQNSQNILERPLKQNKIQAKKKKTSLSRTNSQRKDLPSQALLSQDEGRTAMSLILIDDADIVFEQDDGFVSGIAQLIQCSKRPVIIVTSSLTSLNLQRFLQCENFIKLRPLLPRMLGTWLDLVCLADTGVSYPGAGAKFLDFYRGDIRKATNFYNFFAQSQRTQIKETADEEEEHKIVNCDENSSMSWAGGDSEEMKCRVPSTDDIEPADYESVVIFKDPSNLLNQWWSVHDALATQNNKSNDTNALRAISNALESLSVGDLLMKADKRRSKNDICSSPWYSCESDSVSERDSYESVNNFYDACSETSVHLVESTICMNQEGNRKQEGESISYTIERNREKSLSRHKLLTDSLVPCSVLDRRALALDYWPAFRAICRTERLKTDINSKRNNRFTHYLKTSKVASKSEVFAKLGDTLRPTGHPESIY